MRSALVLAWLLTLSSCATASILVPRRAPPPIPASAQAEIREFTERRAQRAE